MTIILSLVLLDLISADIYPTLHITLFIITIILNFTYYYYTLFIDINLIYLIIAAFYPSTQ